MTTKAITPLRQRMIEDMNARKLCAGTQRGHIRSCKRFAAFLKRSPERATLDDIRRFQLHLAEINRDRLAHRLIPQHRCFGLYLPPLGNGRCGRCLLLPPSC
jgi:hypothetical protein